MVVGCGKQQDLIDLDVRGRLRGRGAGPQRLACPSGSRGGALQLGQVTQCSRPTCQPGDQSQRFRAGSRASSLDSCMALSCSPPLRQRTSYSPPMRQRKRGRADNPTGLFRPQLASAVSLAGMSHMAVPAYRRAARASPWAPDRWGPATSSHVYRSMCGAVSQSGLASSGAYSGFQWPLVLPWRADVSDAGLHGPGRPELLRGAVRPAGRKEEEEVGGLPQYHRGPCQALCSVVVSPSCPFSLSARQRAHAWT